MAGSKVIAIDLGGSNLRVALVNVKAHKILKYIKVDTPKNSKELLSSLYNIIKDLIDKESKSIRGIGVASPGPLKDGVIKNPPNLPLRNFDLKKALEKKFKKKVVVANDAYCVALAEAKLGSKKKNFIVLTFGTGVGGGIVINKAPYIGQGYGGELGHILLRENKDFEDLWQESKILIKKHFGTNLLVKDLFEINDKKCQNVLWGIAQYLGQGMASLINIFDPEIIVLNGGIKETGDKFLRMIKKEVKKDVLIPMNTEIRWTKLYHAGTLGASLLVS